MAAASPSAPGDHVAVVVADQMFGLPIGLVQEMFVPGPITRVPLAPPAITGLLNVRGRVLTVICMRRLLGLPARVDAPTIVAHLEHRGESYGLVVDSVGGIVTVDAATFEPTPSNLDPRWARLSKGVHRLADRLMIVADVDAALGDEPAVLPDPSRPVRKPMQ